MIQGTTLPQPRDRNATNAACAALPRTARRKWHEVQMLAVEAAAMAYEACADEAEARGWLERLFSENAARLMSRHADARHVAQCVEACSALALDFWRGARARRGPPPFALVESVLALSIRGADVALGEEVVIALLVALWTGCAFAVRLPEALISLARGRLPRRLFRLARPELLSAWWLFFRTSSLRAPTLTANA